MIVGRVLIQDDDIPTLERMRDLCEFLADSSDRACRDRDVLDELLQRIREVEPDLGHAHARAFARTNGIEIAP